MAASRTQDQRRGEPGGRSDEGARPPGPTAAEHHHADIVAAAGGGRCRRRADAWADAQPGARSHQTIRRSHLYQPVGCPAGAAIGQGTRQEARSRRTRPARPAHGEPPARHRRRIPSLAPAHRGVPAERSHMSVGEPVAPRAAAPQPTPTSRTQRRGLLVALLAALLAVGSLAAAPAPASAAGIKVAVVVGPAGSLTSRYIAHAREYAAQARSYGATVVEVYTPRATWSRVRSAVQGANLLIYLGHGNGFPNPYNKVLTPLKVDGFGLNGSLTSGNTLHHLLRRVLRPHPGQAGAQRGRDPQPPLLLGRELRAGARRPLARGGPPARRQLRGRLPADRREGRLRRDPGRRLLRDRRASSPRTRRSSRSSGAPGRRRGPTRAASPRRGRPG